LSFGLLLFTAASQRSVPRAIKIWIENAHARNCVQGQVRLSSCGTNRLDRRPVINTVRLPEVLADVGVKPRDAMLRIRVDDPGAGTRAATVRKNLEAIVKRSFDQVAWHRS
jgi:hypothetical protein